MTERGMPITTGKHNEQNLNNTRGLNFTDSLGGTRSALQKWKSSINSLVTFCLSLLTTYASDSCNKITNGEWFSFNEIEKWWGESHWFIGVWPPSSTQPYNFVNGNLHILPYFLGSNGKMSKSYHYSSQYTEWKIVIKEYPEIARRKYLSVSNLNRNGAKIQWAY